jgi:hypothetical protein
MMTLDEAYASFGNPVDGAATIKITAADIRYWWAERDLLRALLQKLLDAGIIDDEKTQQARDAARHALEEK